VIASLLRRLWRSPPAPHAFRPLSAMTDYWSDETLAAIQQWPDTGLVREGLRLPAELARTAPREVLLATDLHRAMNFGRSGSLGWSSIQSHSSGIRPTTQRNTCSTALRDCTGIRTGLSPVSQICSKLIESVFDFGCLPARRRNHAPTGRVTIQ
jgi:hypothetical protein